MSEPKAKVIADSITDQSCYFPDIRLTTIEVVFHRYILAEFNTHRMFSRNSASSRAIPLSKNIERVLTDPAIPWQYGTKKAGMQSGPPLVGETALEADEIWLEAAQSAVECANALDALGVHKEVANRLLEPFLWQTVIVSSTEWDNFIAQRDSDLAQPEMHMTAQAIRLALENSVPNKLGPDDWHLPYMTEDEESLSIEDKRRISVARCCRVSYLNHGGTKSVSSDLELYDKLISADPPHWSPLEHVALPAGPEDFYGPEGNFEGWNQLRHMKEYQ